MRDKRPEIRQKGGTACPPPIGRQMRFGSAKKPRFPGLSKCAREDSNLHGPFSPQALNLAPRV